MLRLPVIVCVPEPPVNTGESAVAKLLRFRSWFTVSVLLLPTKVPSANVRFKKVVLVPALLVQTPLGRISTLSLMLLLPPVTKTPVDAEPPVFTDMALPSTTPAPTVLFEKLVELPNDIPPPER